jgi:nitrogenase molybdenum-cofactor synthesis protein NifE
MVALVREIDRLLANPIWEQVRKPAPWDRNPIRTSAAAQLV